jgi:hypothetical protein
MPILELYSHGTDLTAKNLPSDVTGAGVIRE